VSRGLYDSQAYDLSSFTLQTNYKTVTGGRTDHFSSQKTQQTTN